MANSNGIITAPINIDADVKKVLGETSDSLSKLCTSNKINWASIAKPVHIQNTPFPARNGAWWKGSDGNCGIVPRILNIYSSVKDVITDDGMNGWYYQKPRGGELSPYRLGDFDGYDHNAVFPIIGWFCSEKAQKTGEILAELMYVPGTEETPTPPGSLTLNEISVQGVRLGDWKLGIYITDTEGTMGRRVVGDGLGCRFSCSTLAEGQYIVYPFFALYEMAQQSDDIQNSYLSVPICKPRTFQVVSAEEMYDITVSIGGNQTLNVVRYTVEVTVKSGTVHVYGGYLHCRYTTSSTTSQGSFAEPDIDIGERDITPTNSLNMQGWFRDLDSSKSYRLDLYLRTTAGVIERHVVCKKADIDDPVIVT